MAASLGALFETRSRWFDLGVLVVGLSVLTGCVVQIVEQGTTMNGLELLAVPLIVAIAKFPMVLDRGDGGVEIGFDSSVLMFLVCTLPLRDAILVWSLGVIATQLATEKRPQVKMFNIGLGILVGGASAGVIAAVRGDQLGTPRELLAVSLGAASYFVLDFVLSAVSVAVETKSELRLHLAQGGTLVAIACFVPMDSLGYLGAVMVRSTPWWTLILLAVPLATLLVATRAVTRGGENARRLSVLFDAAVRAQTLFDARQVLDALLDDARRLLRMNTVEVRDEPPGPTEIGARIQDGQRDSWIVAPGQQRARSTKTADQQALEAMAAVSSDAFSRLRLTDDMTHLARHDLLTDLPNRGLLLDRVELALERCETMGTTIALLFVDLDGFKPFNDRFGHAAGDSVLIDVAQRLTSCVRHRDTVARLGGDEFAVLFDDVLPADVNAASERILATLQAGADVAGHHLPLGASIGVAFGRAGDSAEAMLRNADLAMYEAKSRGKGQFIVYQEAIGRSRLQRLELVESLRAAVAAREINVVYQPVVNAVSGRIMGLEALARWRSDGVDIRPDVFIRLAEETGLVVPLGDLVLDKVAEDTSRLTEVVGTDINISVNISAKQLREPDFVDKVADAHGRMQGVGLILEITERDGIGNDEASLSAMRAIVDRGVVFAIDDFGVGFSSISYLKDMPVAIIKADASFSRTIDSDERACALLSSITMMGQALGLDVVVEGIERHSQLDHLRDDVHAPYAQGYLMHRPMTLASLLEVLAANRARTDGKPKLSPVAS